MIVHSFFVGDSDKRVMEAQHDSYSRTIVDLVATGKSLIRLSEAILGTKGSLVARFFREMDGFDHRVVQDMHDQIAAYFRFRHHRWPLFQDDTANGELQGAWRAFAEAEFRALMQEERFAVGFVKALMHQNQDDGYAGEASMRAAQRARYEDMYDHRLPGIDPSASG